MLFKLKLILKLKRKKNNLKKKQHLKMKDQFNTSKWFKNKYLQEANLNEEVDLKEEKSKNDRIFDLFFSELEDFDGVADYLNRYRSTIMRGLDSIDFDYLPKPSMMEEGDSEDFIAKLKADPDNEYLHFEEKRDGSIRVDGRQGALGKFILKYEDQDLGQYKLFTTDDDETGLYVSLNKK